METADIIGIIATVLVLISFLMKEIKAIRMASIVACIVFVIYGLMIQAFAVWLLNGLLIFVHLFFLLRKPPKKQRLTSIKKSLFKKKPFRKKSWFYDAEID